MEKSFPLGQYVSLIKRPSKHSPSVLLISNFVNFVNFVERPIDHSPRILRRYACRWKIFPDSNATWNIPRSWFHPSRRISARMLRVCPIVWLGRLICNCDALICRRSSGKMILKYKSRMKVYKWYNRCIFGKFSYYSSYWISIWLVQWNPSQLQFSGCCTFVS
jgi:hypothetical protein